MKRWAQSEMQTLGLQLFQKLHKRKRDANHNHDIHFLAREITQWLPQGIQSLIAGTYTPQHLQRYYFKGEMVAYGASARQIKSDDRRFCQWWVKTAKVWTASDILGWFIDTCHDPQVAGFARDLLESMGSVNC